MNWSNLWKLVTTFVCLYLGLCIHYQTAYQRSQQYLLQWMTLLKSGYHMISVWKWNPGCSVCAFIWFEDLGLDRELMGQTAVFPYAMSTSHPCHQIDRWYYKWVGEVHHLFGWHMRDYTTMDVDEVFLVTCHDYTRMLQPQQSSEHVLLPEMALTGPRPTTHHMDSSSTHRYKTYGYWYTHPSSRQDRMESGYCGFWAMRLMMMS